MGLEIRCIVVDPCADSVSWPDFGELWFNDKKLRTFSPLSKANSLSKRPESSVFLRDELRAGENTIKICELVYNLEEKRNLRIQENQLYMVGLYLVTRRTSAELVRHIQSLPHKSSVVCQH